MSQPFPPSSPFNFFKQRTDSRMFVDRLFMTTSMIANWDPSYPVEVGDYGEIDRGTGLFNKHGNIFTDKKSNSSQLTTERGAEDSKDIRTSITVVQPEFTSGPFAGIEGLAKAQIKAEFKFSKKYGAAVVMSRPVTTRLEGDLKLLLQGDFKHLLGMRLITQTRTCPAYALYSSARQSETVRLIFKADASPVGMPAGVELDQGWYHEQASGSFRSGSNSDKVFTPFFQLLTINSRGHLLREDPKRPQKPRWEISPLPWDSLDEDGEEIPDDYDSAESSGSDIFEGGN